MDLFNRKALAATRERLSAVEVALAESGVLRRTLDEQARDAVSKLGWEKSITSELTRAKQELEVKNAVLSERLDLLTSGVLDAKPAPAAWTEDVEDAEFLFRTGRLDRGEFEAALEAAGFANTEIEFDSASLPQI